MEEATIKAEIRQGKGKSSVRKLRTQGRVPGVVYGKDVTALPITVSAKEWERLGRHLKRNAILKMFLEMGGKVEERPVMVKDVQTGFANDKILHIDFLQVSMERTVEVEIPVRLTGQPKGALKNGIIELHLRTVMVECLPGQIPEALELDITELDIGDSIHVHEVSIPGVRFLEHSDVAIVTVTPPTTEEQPAVEAVEEEKKEE
jgi:large subunit ribosomal protein L25